FQAGGLLGLVARDAQVFGEGSRALLVQFRDRSRLFGAGQRDSLLFMAFAYRQVARDLREPDESAAGAYGGDHDVRPEARPVFLDTPAFVFEAAVGRGDLQLELALAGPDFFFGIEAREMLPDDLARSVALEALGAGVPRGHVARRIEDEDRVLLHRSDEQPDALLAPLELSFGTPSFGEVAGHLSEADQATSLVANGREDDVRPELRPVLSNAPAFFLEATLALGDLERMVALAGRDLFWRVEDREVPSDDLGRLVTVHPPGAGVPRGDDAVHVEHEDAVVHDALDEQAEAVRALTLGGPLAIAPVVTGTGISHCGRLARKPGDASRRLCASRRRAGRSDAPPHDLPPGRGLGRRLVDARAPVKDLRSPSLAHD